MTRDELTRAKLSVREFVIFSAHHPQLHRLITQESKSDSARMDYLVERHVRPLYETTVTTFEQLIRDGVVPPIAPAHLYYILTGAGPTMFVLGPECRRLTGLDPESDDVIEAHADAVCARCSSASPDRASPCRGRCGAGVRRVRRGGG